MEATEAVHAAADSGPLSLLHEEREVQAFPGKMAWLFEPYLQDLYERRQWQEIRALRELLRRRAAGRARWCWRRRAPARW